MAARLVIIEKPEVIIKDIAEGFVKGCYTLDEFLDIMEAVASEKPIARS